MTEKIEGKDMVDMMNMTLNELTALYNKATGKKTKILKCSKLEAVKKVLAAQGKVDVPASKEKTGKSVTKKKVDKPVTKKKVDKPVTKKKAEKPVSKKKVANQDPSSEKKVSKRSVIKEGIDKGLNDEKCLSFAVKLVSTVTMKDVKWGRSFFKRQEA